MVAFFTGIKNLFLLVIVVDESIGIINTSTLYEIRMTANNDYLIDCDMQ